MEQSQGLVGERRATVTTMQIIFTPLSEKKGRFVVAATANGSFVTYTVSLDADWWTQLTTRLLLAMTDPDHEPRFKE